MEHSEVVRRRRMVRAYSDRPLPEGTADRLVRAALRAPSAGFSQGWGFLVLDAADDRAPRHPGTGAHVCSALLRYDGVTVKLISRVNVLFASLSMILISSR